MNDREFETRRIDTDLDARTKYAGTVEGEQLEEMSLSLGVEKQTGQYISYRYKRVTLISASGVRIKKHIITFD